jgi:hypothetical protein
VRTTSAPYHEREGRPITGFTTNVVYRVPEDVTAQDVVAFYVENIGPEWTYEPDDVPVSRGGEETGRVLLANFRRSEAAVQVNTDGIFPGPGGTYELSIDHKRYR